MWKGVNIMSKGIDAKFYSINKIDLNESQLKAYEWAEGKNSIASRGWYIKNHT